MKKSLLFLGLMVICCAFLVMIGGCAKKEILKEDAALKETPVLGKEGDAEKRTKAKAGVGGDRKEETAAGALAKDKRSAESKVKEAKKDKAAAVREASALGNVHFDFDKYSLRPEGRELLKQHAAWLAANKNSTVTIEGHCDERGTAEYNLALGERRAAEAMKYLVQLGIEEKRMKTISYGFERPLNSGHDEEAWAKNRRDSFVASH